MRQKISVVTHLCRTVGDGWVEVTYGGSDIGPCLSIEEVPSHKTTQRCTQQIKQSWIDFVSLRISVSCAWVVPELNEITLVPLTHVHLYSKMKFFLQEFTRKQEVSQVYEIFQEEVCCLVLSLVKQVLRTQLENKV